jgi:molecular chaperone GrpE
MNSHSEVKLMPKDNSKRKTRLDAPTRPLHNPEGKLPPDATSGDGAQTQPPAEGDAIAVMMISKNDYAQLKQQVDELIKQSADNFDGWQRERADFMNYRKRIEREQEQLNQTVTANVVRKFLGVVDDMERAMKNRPANADTGQWAEGVDLIYRKLQTILEQEGVSRIGVTEKVFDPACHEAISHEDNENYKNDEIIEVVQYGYRIGDRVIRPALVRVAK